MEELLLKEQHLKHHVFSSVPCSAKAGQRRVQTLLVKQLLKHHMFSSVPCSAEAEQRCVQTLLIKQHLKHHVFSSVPCSAEAGQRLVQTLLMVGGSQKEAATAALKNFSAAMRVGMQVCCWSFVCVCVCACVCVSELKVRFPLLRHVCLSPEMQPITYHMPACAFVFDC